MRMAIRYTRLALFLRFIDKWDYQPIAYAIAFSEVLFMLYGKIRIGTKNSKKRQKNLYSGIEALSMSEEIRQRGYTENGLRIGSYEFYQIGNTNLSELKKYKIIPDRQYGQYALKKPDALLVDRRNKNQIKVILVVEYKDQSEFKTVDDKRNAIRQCNTVCQVVGAKIGIATDNSSFIWFNPNEADKNNEYKDDFDKLRDYKIIKDEDGSDFIKEFVINQKEDEKDLTKLEVRTRISLQNLESVKKSISSKNSQINAEDIQDPTELAKQIWQDVWSVSGATPEKCLYTFVELLIFKYLSDLDILTEDDKGNKINFKNIIALSPDKAFKNYSTNVRTYMKDMFPASKEDNTTIINGTVLSPNVPEHSQVFYKILKKFQAFGELKNIDPSFKSKVFEAYMKEDISKKNWGQYFTPRKIVDMIIEISDIDKLSEDSFVCDPACGVGGFILEPIKVKDNGISFYYKVDGKKIKRRLKFIGYDKGFEKEEQLTVILAKANMLIFLSELIKDNPNLAEVFADLLNSTFKLQTDTILGTLSKTEKDKYDLIMTNPPYVTSGSSNYKDAIKKDATLREFYKINSLGVEGLFLEWIIRSLKPSRKAFVIIPDGIVNRLHDNKLRNFIKEECIIDGIISLPVNTFYTTPKKTYIIALTKKSGANEIERKKEEQKDPIFTYLVSDIGETLDVNRFPIDKNDLIEAVSLFNQFKGSKKSFKSESLKCKIQPIEKFNPDEHWAVDRWWTKEEKIQLGIEEADVVLTLDEFRSKVDDVIKNISELNEELRRLK